MTAHRIFATARPTLRLGPVLPMSREDADFWQHRARAAAEARERRAARAAHPIATKGARPA